MSFLYRIAKVGERGQIVIPAEARRKLNIRPGDKLLVLGHPSVAGILLCKIDALAHFLSTPETGTFLNSDDRGTMPEID